MDDKAFITKGEFDTEKGTEGAWSLASIGAGYFSIQFFVEEA